MARILPLALSLLACLPATVHADGSLDPAFGNDGRSALGYLQSDSPQLRGFAQAPSGRIWMFGDDIHDRSALYIARLQADGQPDAGFGPDDDGRRRVVLPADLVAGSERLALRGALVQPDGKPLVFGGLRAALGEGGVFPGLVCRLAVAGTADPGFGPNGCVVLRSFLAAEETCLVEDAAQNDIGQTYVVGNCVGPDLPGRPFLARLTSAGTIDNEFAAGVGMVTPLRAEALANGQHFAAVAVQPDGMTVVGAHFRTNLGERADLDLGVLRFDGGGSPDLGFGNAGLALLASDGEDDEFARDLVLREDGSVLLLGQRTEPAPLHAVAVLAQWHSDGTPDASWGNQGVLLDGFDAQLGIASTLRSLALDPSGRAVVAGTRSGAPTAARTVAGTEFWIAFPRSVAPQDDLELWLTSDTASSGLVSNAMHSIEVPFVVTPGIATRVMLPAELELLGASDATEDKGVQVTTQAPVTLSTLGGRTFTTGAAAVLPRATLGSAHRVMAWGEGLGSGTFLAMAASENDTLVTITPTIPTEGLAQGVPYQRFLQPGQAYHLHAPDGDLTGSLVSADKPLAVFGGHMCANVPIASIEKCDLIVEQMLPTSGWGQQFLVLPFAGQSAGAVVRVLAGQDGTEVRVDGVLQALLDAGGFHQFTANAAVQVVTSKPASVARYAKGCAAQPHLPDECPGGDPAMSVVLPTSQWVSRYSAMVPERVSLTQYYLSLVVPTDAVADVYIDGGSVPPGAFTAIGASGYASAQVPITQGATYAVAAPEPIGVSVHAFGIADGYAFTATASSAGEDPDADDLVVRYRADGSRDPQFGTDGLVLLGHSAAYDATSPSFDAGLRAIASGDSVLVGSASSNGHTEQQFFVGYRLRAGAIFKDGFE